MPSTYRCEACRLTFTVGWYHTNGSGPIGAAELMVCAQCGTQYRLDIALKDRGPEFFGVFTVLVVAVDQARRLEALRLLRTLRDVSPTQAGALLAQLPLEVRTGLFEWQAKEAAQLWREVGATIELIETERIPNANWGPLESDRLLAAEGPAFGALPSVERPTPLPEGLDAFRCLHCETRGSLVGGEMAHLLECPHCKDAPPAYVEGWVT